MFKVILKSLKNDTQRIVLTECTTYENARHARNSWRKILGDKRWHVDRRPGLDTLDHLALTIVEEK